MHHRRSRWPQAWTCALTDVGYAKWLQYQKQTHHQARLVFISTNCFYFYINVLRWHLCLTNIGTTNLWLHGQADLGYSPHKTTGIARVVQLFRIETMLWNQFVNKLMASFYHKCRLVILILRINYYVITHRPTAQSCILQQHPGT